LSRPPVSTPSAKLASLTPLPNLGNDLLLLQNDYFASGSYIFDRTRADAKVSWNPTSKLTTFVRFGMLHYNMQNPPEFGDLAGTNISSSGGNPGHGWGNTYSLTCAGTILSAATSSRRTSASSWRRCVAVSWQAFSLLSKMTPPTNGSEERP
jgi:hypothetical protein